MVQGTLLGYSGVNFLPRTRGCTSGKTARWVLATRLHLESILAASFLPLHQLRVLQNYRDRLLQAASFQH